VNVNKGSRQIKPVTLGQRLALMTGLGWNPVPEQVPLCLNNRVFRNSKIHPGKGSSGDLVVSFQAKGVKTFCLDDSIILSMLVNGG